nr:AAA family ATPase [Lachnospiraceae bacterium]
MNESNIYFATNTYNYGGECIEHTKNKFNASRGNVEFFRQVMDYDALMKFRSSQYMNGTLNAKYYMANSAQIRILDPDFYSVMIGRHEVDPEIEAKNKRCDAEYGYPKENDYYPLLEEIIVDKKGFSYADEMLGKWARSNQGLEDIGDDAYGLYLRQKINRDRGLYAVHPKEAGFEDIQDNDPYYYIYRETAKSSAQGHEELDKVRLYEEKFGSIFRAFDEVPQEKIITAPINQWSFVNAGPGTGKTYTLMKKITYMIENLEADPEGVLVLCFTNAAVNEIKSRIKKYATEEGNRSFINVDVRTFHSFSWLLISQANELFHDRPNYKYIDISQLDYDQSIREATGIIRKFGDEVFGACDHLIVDEIQDLTDERARLVIAMVDECMKNGVGVTILGDSCQAIYDYSDEHEKLFEMKSDRFYKSMFSRLYENGEFYKLEKNHRQSDKLIKLTAPLRQSILSGKSTKVRETIKVLSENVPDLTVGKMSLEFSKSQFQKLTQNEKVCLLCRNNAQVLATSSNLWKRGIKHIVNAYNEFEYLSDWIGKVFCLFTK